MGLGNENGGLLATHCFREVERSGGYAVGEREGVRDQQHAGALALGVGQQHAPDVRLRYRVQHGGHLVADQVARARGQRAGDAEALQQKSTRRAIPPDSSCGYRRATSGPSP